jgi:hypothetical protein
VTNLLTYVLAWAHRRAPASPPRPPPGRHQLDTLVRVRAEVIVAPDTLVDGQLRTGSVRVNGLTIAPQD